MKTATHYQSHHSFSSSLVGERRWDPNPRPTHRQRRLPATAKPAAAAPPKPKPNLMSALAKGRPGGGVTSMAGAVTAATTADRFAKLRALKAQGGSGGAAAAAAKPAEKPKPVAEPVDLAKLAANLAVDVGNCTIEEYAEGNLNFDRKGLLGKRTTVEKILSKSTPCF